MKTALTLFIMIFMSVTIIYCGQKESYSTVEITGITDTTGIAGVRKGNEELWTLIITLECWRVGNGDINKTPITIKKKVSDDEMEKYKDKIGKENIIKIRARVPKNSLNPITEAEFEEFVSIISNDKELNIYLKELQKPITFQDKIFGELTYDRSFNWYSSNSTWSNEEVTVYMELEKGESINNVLDKCYKLWNEKGVWETKIKEFAVKELLPLKNDTWVEEDKNGEDIVISAEEFKSRMKIESILIKSDGDFEFCYNDGNMFFGHSIVIYGNLDIGVERANIEG